MHEPVTSILQAGALGGGERAHPQGINQAVFASHWCPTVSLFGAGALKLPCLDSASPGLGLLRNFSPPCIILINFGPNVDVITGSEIH
jgi:hypothetical protein